MSLRRVPLALAVFLTVAPGLLAAQRLGARVLVAGVRTATAKDGDALRLTGAAFGGEGAIALGPVALAVRYLEGSVANDSAGIDRDLVEGDVTLWARPFRWGAMGIGPHVRSFVAGGSTERWVLWEARARGIAGIVPDVAEAYLEGWLVLGGDADVVEPFGSGRGLEGGVEVTLGRFPVSLRLRYRAERLDLADGGRLETTEHVLLGVGLGRR